MLAFAGYKAGMTHAMIFDNKKGSPTFGQETQVPCTIIECPPLRVIAIRAYRRTPKGMFVLTEAFAKDATKYLGRKLKVGKYRTEDKLATMEKSADVISAVSLVVSTYPEKSGIAKKTPEVFEINVGGKSGKEMIDFAKSLLGKDISPTDMMKEGEVVDVVAVTTGKGTEGPIKRFHVRIQDRHAKQKRRHVGAIAQQVPRKVRWQTPAAGQLGFQRRTEMNKRVIKIGEAKDINPVSGIRRYGLLKSNFVLLQGSVPGPKKRLIMMRSAIRPPKVKVAVPEVREIVK
jgi:large subunit ribosomal protein L3